MSPKLSIGIPTFNRKEQLQKQLESIFRQDLANIDEIIIVDNHSDYNVQELVDRFNSDIIRLVINPFNIKMSTNMMSPFLYCNSEWLWLLSDDDETLENSIQDILLEINNSASNTGMLKFSHYHENPKQKDIIVHDLNEYIDYYYDESNIRSGELVFMSTNVYNVKNIINYLCFGYEYSYTFVGFLVPIFKALDDKVISVSFSSKPIVKYIPPRDNGYSYHTVAMGLSTLSHLPLNLDSPYHKKFLEITMSISFKSLFISLIRSDQKNASEVYNIVNRNIYSYYLSAFNKIYSKILFYCLITPTLPKLFVDRILKKK